MLTLLNFLLPLPRFGPHEAYAHGVREKKPNAWGLYDVHGNVLEWCSDSWGEALLGGTDPISADGSSFRVARGGSWYVTAVYCRSAGRGKFALSARDNRVGFRMALSRVVDAPGIR